MKLKNLSIKNFRCFDSLSIDLDEQLTVLVAKNGQGKSSVLDAIRIGLWLFVRGFDLAKNPANSKENNMSMDDVRIAPRQHDAQNIDSETRYNEMLRQLPCEISLQGVSDIKLEGNERTILEHSLSWTLFRDSESEGSKAKSKNDYSLRLLAIAAQALIRDPERPDINLPIILYYGTGRLWVTDRLIEDKNSKSRQGNNFYMRLFGYRGCLDSSSSYKHFADWFTWVYECYREDLIKQTEKLDLSKTNSVWKDTIFVVQKAIDTALKETGWHTLEYSVSHEKSLVLNHDLHGTLKVEQLSDGIRGVLAMVGDIAYRCIKLNPHLSINAAKEATGVVMIDEVDMHLHPVWQQTVLGDLVKAFPKIQFIVTTHSPQVISTVPSHQIRILEDSQVYSAEAGTKGAESSRILKRIFDVDPRPLNDPNTQLLNKYLDLVYADKWMEAGDMRSELNAIFQGNEPTLTEADLYIENRQWEMDIEKNQ